MPDDGKNTEVYNAPSADNIAANTVSLLTLVKLHLVNHAQKSKPASLLTDYEIRQLAFSNPAFETLFSKQLYANLMLQMITEVTTLNNSIEMAMIMLLLSNQSEFQEELAQLRGYEEWLANVRAVVQQSPTPVDDLDVIKDSLSKIFQVSTDEQIKAALLRLDELNEQISRLQDERNETLRKLKECRVNFENQVFDAMKQLKTQDIVNFSRSVFPDSLVSDVGIEALLSYFSERINLCVIDEMQSRIIDKVRRDNVSVILTGDEKKHAIYDAADRLVNEYYASNRDEKRPTVQEVAEIKERMIEANHSLIESPLGCDAFISAAYEEKNHKESLFTSQLTDHNDQIEQLVAMRDLVEHEISDLHQQSGILQSPITDESLDVLDQLHEQSQDRQDAISDSVSSMLDDDPFATYSESNSEIMADLDISDDDLSLDLDIDLPSDDLTPGESDANLQPTAPPASEEDLQGLNVLDNNANPQPSAPPATEEDLQSLNNPELAAKVADERAARTQERERFLSTTAKAHEKLHIKPNGTAPVAADKAIAESEAKSSQPKDSNAPSAPELDPEDNTPGSFTP